MRHCPRLLRPKPGWLYISGKSAVYTIRATDSEGSDFGSESDTAVLTINVIDVDDTPPVLTVSYDVIGRQIITSLSGNKQSQNVILLSHFTASLSQ